MQNLQSRLKRLEQRKADMRAINCPKCGSYTGPKPEDIQIMPLDTPPCSVCGQPYSVTLNLGRRILGHAIELDSFMEQMNEMTEE